MSELDFLCQWLLFALIWAAIATWKWHHAEQRAKKFKELYETRINLHIAMIDPDVIREKRI